MSSKGNINTEEGDVATKGGSIFDPSSPRYRFVFLFFLCFLTFGSYWCYDVPGALQDSLESLLDINDAKFGLFYSLYSFLNMGIVLVGGFFIDKIGLRIGTLLFSFLIMAGQLVLSVGVSLPNPNLAFIIMIVGRVIFSLGGESLSVAQSTFCSKWFKGKELAFSFGLTLSFARIGSFVNLNVTPELASKTSIPIAFWFGTATCLMSMLMSVLASWSDYRRDKAVKTEAVSAATPFHVKDVIYFPASLWLLYIICVAFYCGVFPFISIAGQPYLMELYGFSQSESMHILSIPYVMAAIMSPFCGYFVDRVGRKPLFMMLCSALISVSFVILLYFPWGGKWVAPVLSMVVMGIAYSLCASSLWPCVPLVVEDDRVGTAYGIMNAIQNGGLAAASEAVSILKGKGTKWPMYFLGGTGIVSVFFCILLIITDLAAGGVLTAGSNDVKTKKEEKEPLLA